MLFKAETEGVLASVVINANQALTLAEVSDVFDRSAIQGTSTKILKLANNTLEALLQNNYHLKSVTIVEDNVNIYVRMINNEYYLVTITNNEEVAGLREHNLSELIVRLNALL